jgi:dolichol-phosphate mannosyltransferase
MFLVISPTLNEADNIRPLVDGVLAHEEFQLLVVDDDSKDGTWQLAGELAKEEPRLHLLRRLENHGFGLSYLDGFRWALERGFSHLFTMDADLSHRPEYLPQMKGALLAGADVVVGSRYTKGGGIDNWSRRRKWLSRGANLFAKAVTRLPVKDCTSGFLGMRAEALRKADLQTIRCNGYGFLIELKHALWRAGARLAEVPIVFHDRERGLTKFNSGMIVEAVKTCFRLRRAGSK